MEWTAVDDAILFTLAHACNHRWDLLLPIFPDCTTEALQTRFLTLRMNPVDAFCVMNETSVGWSYEEDLHVMHLSEQSIIPSVALPGRSIAQLHMRMAFLKNKFGSNDGRLYTTDAVSRFIAHIL